MTGHKCTNPARENMCERVMIGFWSFTSDWMTKWREIFSQSHGVEMQNQTRSCLSCFRIVSSFILEGKGLRTTASSPEPLWSMERMQAYFCYVKTIKPQLTPESIRWVDFASDMTQTIFSIHTFKITHGVSSFIV